MLDYHAVLDHVIAVADEAGAMLRDELYRQGGPRGEGGHAEIDTQVELHIRERLLPTTPGWGFLGEETGFTARAPGEDHLWVVDPNDGTRSYLRGSRGSAVSIAVLRDGRPVLGVVYAFAAPDGRGDLFAWAEGCGPVLRNGVQTSRRPWPVVFDSDTLVAVSQSADRAPAANLAAVAPGRYLPTPSIAYRLALAAAGAVDLAATVNYPCGWDIAGGHALLAGSGGVLVDAQGREVTYTADGAVPNGAFFGGAPALAAALAGRYRAGAPAREVDAAAPFGLVQPVRGQTLVDDALLSRAQGCLLGQLAGDALGSMVEFRSAAGIAAEYADGPSAIGPSPVFNTLAGQPTDDSELALMLARCLLARDCFDIEAIAAAYAAWYRSEPFDIGTTTRRALGAIAAAGGRGSLVAVAHQAADPASQANGALMRQSPLAIWGHRLAPEQLQQWVREDTRLTHPHRVCQDASAAFIVALAAIVRAGLTAKDAHTLACDWQAAYGDSPVVSQALHGAAHEPPHYERSMGHVPIALQNAFYQALHAPSLQAGIIATVRGGGDTDTNAAIAGALLGALHGRDAVPEQWRTAVLTCRPHPSRVVALVARPLALWPVDALVLGERLAWAGQPSA